jgi:hypothetical protein
MEQETFIWVGVFAFPIAIIALFFAFSGGYIFNQEQFIVNESNVSLNETWLSEFANVTYINNTYINQTLEPIRLNIQYPTISYGEIYYLSKQNGTITKWDLRSSDSGSVNIVVYNSTTTKFTAILSSASSNSSIVSVPVIDGEEILANITSVSGLDDFTLTMEVQ